MVAGFQGYGFRLVRFAGFHVEVLGFNGVDRFFRGKGLLSLLEI